MSRATPATLALARAGIAFRPLSYDYDPAADRIGIAAAAAVGIPAAHLLKTLMVEIDGLPAYAVIPADRSLSMKRVAAAFGGKAAQMMAPSRAEKLTGYHTGGISPFGQRRPCPTAIEAAAIALPEVIINGGQRGLLLALSPHDALHGAAAIAAPLCAD